LGNENPADQGVPSYFIFNVFGTPIQGFGFPVGKSASHKESSSAFFSSIIFEI
jgi:hypothetical protein